MNISTPSRTTVAVVGLGYVGLPLALLAQRKGYSVIGIDVNEQKADLIRNKISPFRDHVIERELKKSSLEISTDFSSIRAAGVIIICVPTPVTKDRQPNLEPLESAARAIAPFLQAQHLVILESTVNPGVTETVIRPILEAASGLTAGKDFHLAHCPERINPGDTKWTVENIPRVIGSLDPLGLEKAVSFYRSIISGEIKPMATLQEAEAVKIVENAFRDVNIAFVNELAMSFSRLGIDVVNVIEGAAIKPFAFMPHYPGCGVGGHCIPVDPYYLIEYARKNGFNHNFLSLARRINNYMPKFTVERVMDILHARNIPMNGAHIAVLGLAYKAEIDDLRESPAFEIIKHLEDLGAKVRAFDPHVPHTSTASSLKEALQGADVAIIVTPHQIFKTLQPKDFLRHGVSAIVDGRNCLQKNAFTAAGIMYRGIGR